MYRMRETESVWFAGTGEVEKDSNLCTVGEKYKSNILDPFPM